MEARQGGSGLLGAQEALRERKEDRGEICDFDQREGSRRAGCRGVVQGIDRGRERVSTAQRRAGDATDLSSDRNASASPYFRGGVGVIGSTPSLPPAGRRWG